MSMSPFSFTNSFFYIELCVFLFLWLENALFWTQVLEKIPYLHVYSPTCNLTFYSIIRVLHIENILIVLSQMYNFMSFTNHA